jgi:hypothetical protein
MSFTSHIFTSLPLVHKLNPDFLRWHLWLCFLLVRESPRSGNLHISWLSNSSSIILPNFIIPEVCGSAGSRLWVFTNSRLRGFESSGFQTIVRSRLRDVVSFRFQIFASSRLWDFVSFRFQIFAGSLLLKTYITNFINLDVSRVTCFPKFPNTSPSGKRVDSDDPIPQTFQNFSKNVTLGTSEGTHVIRKNSQRSNRGAFAEIPPLAPINRRLPLSKFFHRSIALLRTVVLSFVEKRLEIYCLRLQIFSELF